MKTIHYSTGTHPVFAVRVCALLISGILSPAAFSDAYYFDPGLLQGSVYGQNIEKYNHQENNLPEGHYALDVYVNGQLVREKEDIAFKADSERDGQTEPCLTVGFLKEAQVILKDSISVGQKGCLFLKETGQTIGWTFSQSTLRLDLSVPHDALYRTPRGYIPISEWDDGISALLMRHNTNFYRTENTSSHYRYSYLWSGINTGVNIGLWQFRHQGNLRYSDSNVSGSAYKYNSVRTWAQRPIPALESIATVGESYTNSSLFGSLSFNGIKLATDQRMWPQGKRGYAPEVRGVARTTARVVVRQQGKVVYETTVSPGAFVIDDLYNTRSQGDLQVDVIEAGGQVSSFTVPYSSVPDSVRPGSWNYELALGRVRQYASVDNRFIEGVLQRGVSNELTANLGVRLGDDYQAGLLGGVVATSAGAFGLNTTYSHAKVENDRTENGWRVEASYSKTFSATGTNLVLAAYRYSTQGYRDLQDVLGVRRQVNNGMAYYSDTLNQRNRFSATLSQPMEALGTLNLTGSTSDYYGNASHITQLQLGYSNSWRDISYNLNVARQRTVWNTGRYYTSVDDDDYNTDNRRQHTENTVSLGISIPLNFGETRATLAFDMSQTGDGKSATTSVAGSAGEQGNFTYSVYAGAEKYRNDGDAMTWGGTVQQNTAVGGFRASLARGKDYQQVGLGASGSVLVHRGGITAGPYTSETFALVHAPGATGAVVRNGQGATVDRFGYALLPSLTPYRYNTISLDTKEMSDDVELQGGSKRVAPYAGAVSRIDFKTLTGRAVLIKAAQPDGTPLPMGADVMNSDNTVVGMVGQGGQIYARLQDASGVLFVSWGSNRQQQCRINYQLPSAQGPTFAQLAVPCIQE